MEEPIVVFICGIIYIIFIAKSLHRTYIKDNDYEK